MALLIYPKEIPHEFFMREMKKLHLLTVFIIKKDILQVLC